jgi:hypothetical protein
MLNIAVFNIAFHYLAHYMVCITLLAIQTIMVKNILAAYISMSQDAYYYISNQNLFLTKVMAFHSNLKMESRQIHLKSNYASLKQGNI